MDDLETRLQGIERSQVLLAKDHENLSKLVEVYEKRHEEDREDAKRARQSIPTYAHLAFEVFLGYMALRGH